MKKRKYRQFNSRSFKKSEINYYYPSYNREDKGNISKNSIYGVLAALWLLLISIAFAI